MAETFETHRELEVDKSADEVWQWLSNIGNAMTTNQFHMSIDCDPADARNPKVGMDVPILHEIMERQHIRLAKITKYEDYAISWGERLPDDVTHEDRFPHSEGWTVEALGPNKCLLRNRLRGRHLFPLAEFIGKQLWDTIIPPILDNEGLRDPVHRHHADEALERTRDRRQVAGRVFQRPAAAAEARVNR